ncbi:MAG: ATP-dependent DNA helicase [Elusimicrobiota bacterium]|nr:ATP-dependent DNA helicase [Elusimicrobiota bacterium]
MSVDKRGKLTVATAGAGTGKTTYLVREFLNKVEFLTGEGFSIKDALGSVLAVTFSRKAAGEMKERVIKKLGDPGLLPFLNIATIDAFCAEILRENPVAAGIDSRFEILTGGNEHIFFKKILEKARSTLPLNLVSPLDLRNSMELYSFITHLRHSLITPERLGDLRWEGGGDFLLFLRSLYGLFETEMKRRQVLDFPQLLLEAYKLLDKNEDIGKSVREKYRFVFIDEFQDTSPVQMALFTKINPGAMCVVGDFNQSIYAFRGAAPENLSHIKSGADYTKSLSTNYRSDRSVLDFANLIADKLKNYQKLVPRADAPAGKPVKIVISESREQEALYIAREIKRLKKEEGLNNSDFAVILRSLKSAVSDYEKVFRAEGIDFLTASGGGFYERPEIKQLTSILKFLSSPGDDGAFFEFLSSPMISFTLAEIHSFGSGRKRGVSLFEAFLDSSGAVSEAKKNRVEFFLKNRKFPGTVSIHRYVMAVILDCGLTEWVKANFEGVYRLRALANIKKFMELALVYEKMSSAPVLSEFIEYISGLDKQGAVESDAALDAADCVDIMTVHKIKGLERKVVFVSNITPFQFPGRNTSSSPWEITDKTIRRREKKKGKAPVPDEEWRLFYVAMTRAMKRLYLLGRPSKRKRARGKTAADSFSPMLSYFLGASGERVFLKEECSGLAELCFAEGKFENKEKQGKKMVPVFRKIRPSEFFSEKTVIDEKLKKGFTVSEINDYYFCPLRYRNDYILKKTISGPGDFLKLGNVFHTAIEHFDKNRGGGFFRNSVMRSLPPGLTGRAEVMSANFLSSDFIEEPFMKEAPFSLNIVRGSREKYTIKGAIDRVEKKKSFYGIYDYKTGRKSDASPYALPMNIYALGCKYVFGLEPVKKLGLFFLQTGETPDVDIMEEEALLKKLDGIINGIKAGDFHPSPGAHCRACPYSRKCKAKDREV